MTKHAENQTSLIPSVFHGARSAIT